MSFFGKWELAFKKRRPVYTEEKEREKSFLLGTIYNWQYLASIQSTVQAKEIEGQFSYYELSYSCKRKIKVKIKNK